MNIGVERSVPATKSFTSTIVALMMLDESRKKLLEILPEKLESHIQRVMHEQKDQDFEGDDVFIVGDSWGLGLAREFALKLQEVAYTKTLWFPGHEMKHGPLALVDKGTRVFYYGLSGSQITEILKSRGATVVHSSEHFSFIDMMCDIASMQIAVYRFACKKGLPIDTPRNLAKSVTV
jgi:glucosamine--fructose-6-phosphate aminotransferase (isomerizing)